MEPLQKLIFHVAYPSHFKELSNSAFAFFGAIAPQISPAQMLQRMATSP